MHLHYFKFIPISRVNPCKYRSKRTKVGAGENKKGEKQVEKWKGGYEVWKGEMRNCGVR